MQLPADGVEKSQGGQGVKEEGVEKRSKGAATQSETQQKLGKSRRRVWEVEGERVRTLFIYFCLHCFSKTIWMSDSWAF